MKRQEHELKILQIQAQKEEEGSFMKILEN